MVPEIWCATEFFSHFGLVFALPPPPPLTNNPEKQNFEKMKKMPGNIITLHKCTINDNHTMYSSSDMKRDTQFFVILGHFFVLLPK